MTENKATCWVCDGSFEPSAHDPKECAKEMQRTLHKLTKVNAQWKNLSDAQERSLELFRAKTPRLQNALEAIIQKRGMTQLSECCVHKNCSPLYDEGEKIANCKWQAGVARGFNECADIASEALAKLEEKF